jgi:DNA-binding NarL/FixJ family response regulator
VEEVGPVRAIADLRELEDVASTSPDPIVVVDLDEAMTEVRELVRDVRAIQPNARIVVLASDATGEVVLAALRLGVRACIRKPDGLQTLGEVLTRVACDEVVVPLDLRRDALEELGRVVRRARDGTGVDALLSPREHQILNLLASGLTTRQISSCLAISPRTVEGHTSGIYRKLVVATRVQALSRAAALGLVDAR